MIFKTKLKYIEDLWKLMDQTPVLSNCLRLNTCDQAEVSRGAFVKTCQGISEYLLY